MQRRHEEQSACSKGAHLSPLDDRGVELGGRGGWWTLARTWTCLWSVLMQVISINHAVLDLKTCRGGEHRRGKGSETFSERTWVLRRFPEVS